MATKAHSPIGASSCERWWNCPGSIPLIDTVPPALESEYAAQGTAAHEVAEDALRKGRVDQAWVGEEIEVGEHLIKVDDEMVDSAQIYLDTVMAKMEQYNAHPTTLLTEVSFTLSEVDPEAYGTCDSGFCAPYGPLVVIDFKYGKGVAVEVAGNKQLLYYALGFYLALSEEDRADVTGVEAVIIQPRAYHPDGIIRSTFYTVEDLMVFKAELKEAVGRVRVKDSTLSSGTHCKFCVAKPVCPEMRKTVQKQAQVDFANIADPKNLPAPASLTPEQLGSLLGHAQMIMDWTQSVIKMAHLVAETGKIIPGYKLVEKFGNRRWKNPDEIIKAYEIELGDELFEQAEPKLLSPAKLEKKLGKKRAAEVAEFTEKPSTGKTLVPVADARPGRATRRSGGAPR